MHRVWERPRTKAGALLIATVAALAYGAFASAAITSTTLTPLQRGTLVRSYGGWLLFSRWDGSAYHLSTWHTGTVTDLDVPTQSKPFDADAGPDSNGNPSAVYSQCAKGQTCDLFVISFAAGATPRPVNNANTTDHNEVAPSVWNGTLIFGRVYDADSVIPYAKRIQAPRSTPSTRLAGLPDERCGAGEPPDCRPIKDVSLLQMDLAGQRVAQSWTYQPDGFPGHLQNEIRLTNLDRNDTRQLAFMTTGEGGQSYFGPEIVNGRVAFLRACLGDPGGCSSTNSGDIRYQISSNSYELIGANVAWQGWSFDGTSDFHVPSDFDCSGGDAQSPPTEACGLIRRDGLSWSPVAADKIR
jgi:hypothetical protein